MYPSYFANPLHARCTSHITHFLLRSTSSTSSKYTLNKLLSLHNTCLLFLLSLVLIYFAHFSLCFHFILPLKLFLSFLVNSPAICMPIVKHIAGFVIYLMFTRLSGSMVRSFPENFEPYWNFRNFFFGMVPILFFKKSWNSMFFSKKKRFWNWTKKFKSQLRWQENTLRGFCPLCDP